MVIFRQPYINRYINESAAAREKLKDNAILSMKYRAEERSVMDIFLPKNTDKSAAKTYPIHIYIHGGYWQELSKDESAFAAPNFTDHEIIFIALDYQLAPKATMAEIISQTQHGVVAAIKSAKYFHGDIRVRTH